MCPYKDYMAVRWWGYACHSCRGSKLIYAPCNDPESCQNALGNAWGYHMDSKGWS